MKNFNNFRIDPVKFRNILNGKGIKGKDVAEAVGCKPGEISRYLSKKDYATSPKSDRVLAIAAFLDVKPEDFLTLKVPMAVANRQEPTDSDMIQFGVHYNGYAVEAITLADRVFWQSDYPARDDNQRSVYFELPDLLAEYLAKAMSLGLDRLQGPRLIDNSASDVVADAEAIEKAILRKKRPHDSEEAG